MRADTKTSIWSYYGGSNPFTTEFCKEHGSRSVQRGDHFYFEDGAIRGAGTYGQHIGPPSDPVESQEATVRFWEHAVSKAAEFFYGYRDSVALYNSEIPDVMATLKQLQEQAIDCKAKLKASKRRLLCVQYDVETFGEARKLRDEERRRDAAYVEQAELEEQQRLAKVWDVRI